MSDTLKQAKGRVRDVALGRHGIHAVGIKRSEDAVTVHFAGPGVDQATARELAELAKPHRLLVIESEKARLSV